jgi:drug/metabolite transporter (DMT)-like permease
MSATGQARSVTLPHWLTLALAVLFVSSSAIITRFTEGGAMAVAGWRLAIATALLLLWGPARRGVKDVSRGDLMRTAVAAFFLAVHFGAWIASLRLVPVAVSVVLVSTHPVFVAGLRAAFGERPSLFEATGIAVALAGLVWMTGAGASDGATLYGCALAVLGAAALAVYLVIGSGVRQRVPTTAYLVLVYGMAGAGLLITQTAAGGRLMPPSALDAALYLALALVPTIGGHGLFAHAVGHVRPVVVSICFLAEPVVATLLAIPVFGEQPGPRTIAGGLMVLAGLALVTVAGAGRRVADTCPDSL